MFSPPGKHSATLNLFMYDPKDLIPPKSKVSSLISLCILVAFLSFIPAKGGGDCSVSSGLDVTDCFLAMDFFCGEKC